MAPELGKTTNALSYTSHQLYDDLDGIPDLAEIRRLADCYPSYAKAWRTGLLQGILDGKSHTEMVAAKMRAKGVATVTPQAKGGYATTIPAKLRKTAIRMLYLRYRLDQGML